MEKETVLANIKFSFNYSEETQKWLSKYLDNSNVWFASSEGTPFFGEYSRTWDRILIDNTQYEVKEYFLSLGLSENNLPIVKINEHYAGSWIIDASIVMATTIGSTYIILKGISELPKIVDGLVDLKNRIKKKVHKDTNDKVRELLDEQRKRFELKSPPKNVIESNFTIDARPILSLTPAKMKHHKIHLSVGVSEESITIENLSDDVIKSIKIGLFKSKEKRNQWSYADAYSGYVELLSPNQTICKSLEEFKNGNSEKLTIDELPINIDCWIQDDFGIYLFMFYLD